MHASDVIPENPLNLSGSQCFVLIHEKTEENQTK